MGRKALLLFPVLAVAVAMAGCGGDDDGDGSAAKKLAVSQASADVQEFCNVSGYRAGEFYQRGFFTLLLGVDALIRAYNEHPDLEVQLDPKAEPLRTEKIVRKAATDLRHCGPDGRQQAKRLRQTITPS